MEDRKMVVGSLDGCMERLVDRVCNISPEVGTELEIKVTPSEPVPELPARKLSFGDKRRKRMQKDPLATHMVKVYHSPGHVANGRPRPTGESLADGQVKLHAVQFSNHQQLVYSDGSFRSPGRRKIVVQMPNGEAHQLSGRQLRALRKTARRQNKARVAAQATSNTLTGTTRID